MDTQSILEDRKLLICLTGYLSALVASNTLGLKLMPFIFGTHLSVAVFISLSFF